ncbi:MAG: hypothetical protein AB1Z67_01590 [Candidatus Limnocylindrales bacterium]
MVQGRLLGYLDALARLNLSDDERRIPPVAAYDRNDFAAVTGGLVVRDSAGLPAISGQYVFADSTRGMMWALGPSEEPAVVTPLMADAGPVVSFAEGPDGAVLTLSCDGTISRLEQGD